MSVGENSDFSSSSLPPLLKRVSAGHKGTYGTAVLVGGSRGMSGAAALAGSAALTAGAGLVRLFVPETIASAAAFRPEYTLLPFPADRKGRFALDALPLIKKEIGVNCTVGLGPGLGRSLGLELLVVRLYQTLVQPMVIDADALNALAARELFVPADKRRLFDGTPPVIPAGPRILTPHPGEFARLFGEKIGADRKSRVEAAKEFMARVRALCGNETPPIVLVLKGEGTVVTDGEKVYVNETGNPGMGTGGAGDVLTGIITALTAQKYPPFDAAVLGVYYHGAAGDIAAAEKGEISVTARDLIEYLPQAFLMRR